VHLVWRGAEVNAAEARVERRGSASDTWQTLGAPTARGRDELEYEDLTAEAGASYVYRLTRGAEALSHEVSVEVPAAAVFALAGARPNPALSHELSVAFSLAGAGTAKLELFDLAGRREYLRPLHGLGPGRRTLSLAEAKLAPGIHWLHLTEGASEAMARVVIVR
jgi:hypothetical protein